MLTARIEAGQREECVAVGEAVGVKSEVCEALLAVVEDLAVVLLVGPRHVVVVIEEGAVCVLQLGEVSWRRERVSPMNFYLHI